MEANKILNHLESNPIIATVRKDAEIKKVIKSKVKIVFVLNASVNSVGEKINLLKNAGKIVFIHIDLVSGLSHEPSALEYIADKYPIDGILTTKKSLITKANQLGLFSVFRIFAIDSVTIISAPKLINNANPNAIEILPGVAPKAVELVKRQTNIPIITGGLIETDKEVAYALKSGAIGISTSCEELWNK